MHNNAHEDRLLDLGPRHLTPEGGAELEALLSRTPEDRAAAERELRYLSLVGARKVAPPSDAHFAAVRAKIMARVTIRRQTFWDRLVAAVFPAVLRPIPAALTTAAIAVAVLLVAVYVPRATSPEVTLLAGDFGPHVTIADNYSRHVTVGDGRVADAQALAEYREILLKSSAILGSPSSLSRSRMLSLRGL